VFGMQMKAIFVEAYFPRKRGSLRDISFSNVDYYYEICSNVDS